MSEEILMPKATAAWLIDNTALSFAQIADFCNLHLLEVQRLADEDGHVAMAGVNPVASGQLSWDDIKMCEADKTRSLVLQKPKPSPFADKKGKRYVPLAKRQDRPDAILWMIKNYPHVTDSQIANLLGSTKPTVASIRNKTHWNSGNLRPKDPVQAGFCRKEDLEHLPTSFSLKTTEPS